MLQHTIQVVTWQGMSSTRLSACAAEAKPRGRRLHIGMAEFAEDFGGSVSKAALGSVSVMKMAAGYLGKAVAASKVEKQTEKAGAAVDPANPAAAAVEDEGGSCVCGVIQV